MHIYGLSVYMEQLASVMQTFRENTLKQKTGTR